MYNLPLWEGDKIFLRLLDTTTDFFTLKLRYEEETLVEALLNGTEKIK
jgi:8-oxo-dGTP diphosphatase